MPYKLVRYIEFKPTIYTRMLDGETRDQAIDRLIERIDPDGDAVISFNDSEIKIETEAEGDEDD